MSSHITRNFQEIQEKISQAAERSGRNPNEIRLLAATKKRNVSEILEVTRAGVDLIGENTVQEALSKFEFLPQAVEKHMIGSLQLNKVRQAVRLFNLIQSVNSLELAEHVDEAAREIDKVMPVLIEVNVAEESSKRGMEIEEVRQFVEQISKLSNLKLRGLMAMAPYLDSTEELRPIFAEMKSLFEELSSKHSTPFDTLSMGMSNDYVTAIEEGSTLVRLGTILFGERDYS